MGKASGGIATRAAGPSFPNPGNTFERFSGLLSDRRSIEAWVYLYNWPTDARELIPSGDFLVDRTDVRHDQSRRGWLVTLV
ncbi:MAG: hypothetical protein IIC50_03200 [Planctomycetes bacterium]|nr:hypothetical protein [Planctomycetota bacterium]